MKRVFWFLTILMVGYTALTAAPVNNFGLIKIYLSPVTGHKSTDIKVTRLVNHTHLVKDQSQASALITTLPPAISYTSPIVYTVNAAITPLAPTNTGGAVPATVYGQVTTFAGSGATGSLNATGTAATFNRPYNSVIDASGNVYVAEYINQLIRKITPAGVVSTFAGSGSQGFANGTGTAASFNDPGGLAIDPSGNIYVGDQDNNMIRKITPAGVVTTYAGSGITGSANGGSATASFYGPAGLIFDGAGNLYVADRNNNLIRKITQSGMVSTFAGSGAQGSADGTGPAASFYNCTGLTIDASGNIYVTDQFNNKIREITPAGVVTTFAGSGIAGKVDGTGIAASFYQPFGLTIDQSSGTMYVADEFNNLIRKITPGGVVTTLAGNGVPGTVNGIGISASFNYPAGIIADGSGNLYVTETLGDVIRKIVLTGYTIDKTLPAGLTFDATTGIISGTPTAVSAATNYTVTAYNVNGSSSAIASIAVNAAPAILPPNISYQTPKVYTVNNAITPLVPANSGGAVPANVYGQVSTYAGIGATGAANGTAATATFNNPRSTAVDASGNVYVTDQNNNLVRKISVSGIVSTLAGSGIFGFANGTGTSASFRYPSGIGLDMSNNVFITDAYNSCIREITPAGVVTTFAGSVNTYGSADGVGTAATFSDPTALAIDALGNIYVADGINYIIRKITPAAVVTTIAGTGKIGFSNGTGTAASISLPTGIAVDASGNIYVSDNNNNAIRKITPAGVVSTFAGNGLQGSTDGTGTAATFNSPQGLTTDAAGNVYVADYSNNKIRKITPAGVVTTLAGNGQTGAINGPNTLASFNNPEGLSVDAANNIYVADYGNNLIRKIALTGYSIDKTLPAGLTFDATTGIISGTPTVTSPATNYTVTAYNASGSSSTIVSIAVNAPIIVLPPNISYQTPQVYTVNKTITPLAPTNSGGAVPATVYGQVSTLAGSTYPGSANGTGTAASFYYPAAVATDASGNVFVADSENNLIRMITPAGVVTTLAGSGARGSANGTGAAASFYGPSGIAVDASGNVYVADEGNNLIREISPAGLVSTLAGSGSTGSANGAGTAASFNAPTRIAIDVSGNLYVADDANNLIREISPAGVVTTLAGSGSKGSANGTGTKASFSGPNGIAVDASGNVYVADQVNELIRKISPSGVVTTLAGSGSPGLADGTGTAASFYNPLGLATDAIGNVYVADATNDLIRKISPAGVVTTLAGTGSFGATNGVGTTASFNDPTGVALDASGNMYVADDGNNLIRKITLTGYSISPALPTGLTFDATTGIISGTPTVTSAATNYTVTAYNLSGSSTTVVNIAVNAAPLQPPAISYQTPQVYIVNKAITALAPTNTGGGVPANVPAVVSTFAGGRAPVTYDATGTGAGFNLPSGITADAAGNIYVSDYGSGAIRKITSAAVVTTIGNVTTPSGLVVDSQGNLFVTDFQDNYIYEISSAGIKQIFAGSGAASSVDGTGVAASFNNPGGITIDASGYLYVAEQQGNKIRKITPAGAVTAIAGNGAAGASNGPPLFAAFNNPDGLVVDSKGNIYVADTKNNLIREISQAGVVSTFAGSGTAGNTNGSGTAASFNYPTGITIDASGNLYVADYHNNEIRKITPAGVVSTFAGNGSSGSTNGSLTSSSFNGPLGLSIDATGNLYVTDYLNYLVRKITLTGYTIDKPLPAGLTFDGTNGIISGTPTAISPATNYTVTAYNVSGSSSFTINITVVSPTVVLAAIPAQTTCSPDFDPGATGGIATITYTSSNAAVATIVAGKVHITGAGVTTIIATDGTTSAQQALTVTAPVVPTVNITAAATTVCTGAPVTFTATATSGGANPTYQWQVNGFNAGTNNAVFTAGNLNDADIVTCIVTNTSSQCPTAASATSNAVKVSVASSAPVLVTVTASANGVRIGTSITFTATVQTTATASGYQWRVNGTNAGTNSPVFTSSTLQNGDKVTCTVTFSNGCTPLATSAPITEDLLPLALIIPNTFTPNGDGINDTWQIQSLNQYFNCSVKIFNRFGQLIYSSVGYGVPWDGSYRSSNAPVGTYYYIIDTKDTPGTLSGSVTLLR